MAILYGACVGEVKPFGFFKKKRKDDINNAPHFSVREFNLPQWKNVRPQWKTTTMENKGANYLNENVKLGSCSERRIEWKKTQELPQRGRLC